jgi:large subunit ribosomal protein L19e
MNLTNKKELASRALGVGKNRIIFNQENLKDIKEAITKQDIKDLYSDGVIEIKPIKGRKKIVRRKTKRGPGKIKKKVNVRKQTYVKITRKLRTYVSRLKALGVVDLELSKSLRKKIRTRAFRSKAHLKEYIEKIEEISLKPDEILKKHSKVTKEKKDKKVTKEKKETKEKPTKKNKK